MFSELISFISTCIILYHVVWSWQKMQESADSVMCQAFYFNHFCNWNICSRNLPPYLWRTYGADDSKGPIKRSKHLSQHSHNICCEPMLRPFDHPSQQCCDHISFVFEMLRGCCGRLTGYGHNMSQQMLWECCDRALSCDIFVIISVIIEIAWFLPNFCIFFVSILLYINDPKLCTENYMII